MLSRIGIALLLLPVSGARAAEARMPLELLSAYVFRGETRNDGAVAQPAVEISGLRVGDTPLPLTFGVWGNFDFADRDGRLESGEFSEVDFYLLAAVPLSVKPFTLHAGYWEYIFPGVTRVVEDEDDEEQVLTGAASREISVGLAADCLLHPALTCYFGVGGALEGDLYVEADIFHDFELSPATGLKLSARAGYLRADDGPEGFKALTLSADWHWRMLTLGLDCIRALDDEVLPEVDEGGAFDIELVGRAGVEIVF
jgi:hypothetical protein